MKSLDGFKSNTEPRGDAKPKSESGSQREVVKLSRELESVYEEALGEIKDKIGRLSGSASGLGLVGDYNAKLQERERLLSEKFIISAEAKKKKARIEADGILQEMKVMRAPFESVLSHETPGARRKKEIIARILRDPKLASDLPEDALKDLRERAHEINISIDDKERELRGLVERKLPPPRATVEILVDRMIA